MLQARALLLPEKELKTDTSSFSYYMELSASNRQTNIDISLEFAFKALSKARTTGKKSEIAYAYNEIGVLFYLKGEYYKAIENYNCALDIDKAEGNTEDVALRYNNIGQAYSDLGDYSEAIDFFKEALSIDRKSGDSSRIAIRLNNIGIVYFRFEQYPKALDFFREALKIDSIKSNASLLPARLNNIGKVYLQMQKFNEALQFFSRALEMDQKLGHEQDQAIRYSNLGQTSLATNKYVEALNYFQKALEIDSRFRNKSDIASDLYYIGLCFKRMNKRNDAEQYFKMSLQKSSEISYTSNLIDIYRELSSISEENGNSTAALAYYKKWATLKDSLFDKHTRKKLSDFQSFYESEKRAQEIILLQKEKVISNLSLAKKEQEIESQRVSKLWYVTLLLLIILIIVFVYHFILQREKKKQLNLKQQLNLYMQKALIQQMNPHFFFNTLNSIQYYILKNDKVTSNKYLSMFARLMRTTLNNSQSEVIPLSDELDALKTYIELEQLRFVNRFDFSIEIEDDIDSGSINIPPFILQPYIENAIWHGLMNLEEGKNGILLIRISRQENKLLCIIEDNGIGREKAKEINAKSGKFPSLGTRITETRISLINQLYKSKFSVDYSDVLNDINEISGTRVEITLGIENIKL